MCLHTKRTYKPSTYKRNNMKKKSLQMFFFVELFIFVFYVHKHVTMSLHNALKTFYVQKEQYEKKSSQMFFFVELFILVFYIHEHISSEVFLLLNYSYSFSTYTSTSPHHFTTKTKHSQTHITLTNNMHRPSPRALPSNGSHSQYSSRQQSTSSARKNQP